MWKIDTTMVSKCMSVTDTFINDFFCWAKENNSKTKEEIEETLKNDDSSLGKVANGLTGVFDLLIKLSLYQNIEEIYEVYTNMTADYYVFLENGACVADIPEESLKLSEEIFKYFYETLLDRQTFWENYSNGFERFSKSIFRETITKGRQVCPYCDMNLVTYNKQSNTDHFLALTYFPVLSVKWENLVVSCVVCNLYLKNAKLIGTYQGKSSYIPMLHPYFHEVAEHIQFTFDDSLNIGVIPSDVEDERAKNYCELFELESIYQGAQKIIEMTWLEIYNTIKIRFNNEQGLSDESPLEKLVRMYKEQLSTKLECFENGIGGVPYVKILIDLLRFKLSEVEMKQVIDLLAMELNIKMPFKQFINDDN